MANDEKLKSLFESWSGEKVNSFSPLPASASARKYFRIACSGKTAIGVYNADVRENRAFVYLTKHFQKNKLNVPKIYSTDLKSNIYLLEDLGDQTLFSFLESHQEERFNDETKDAYRKIIELLPRFQITASKKLDYSKCYPRAKFDKQSIMWDLNYFKYYFLKLAKISFDEQKLEDDFDTLVKFLLQADCNYFMYRDFNSRNVMLFNSEPFFIDYQGGRKGALQYDIASFLLDSKANIPPKLREEFLNHYIKSVKKLKAIDRSEFLKYYYGYVLIRLLQMFGAYGYRGYFEGKSHFLKSIPYAVRNLEWLLQNHPLKIKMPELLNSLNQIIHSAELKNFDTDDFSAGKLTVRINSFSYREKIPIDLSGNGGGFVFDCRAIHNPGRYDEYKSLTGKDKPVADFLNSQHETQKFLQNVFSLVDESVEKYLSRGFTDLMVNFGCTGGQHRSVYCAERLGEHLAHREDLTIVVSHTNLKKEGLSD
ncbi:MAG: phosphotransferase [Bacteroidetes bacterium]|nr:phosphotransferase [Bacteroidota bacterium]